MIKTAVVILNWNGKRLLEQFLPSVTQYSIDENTAVVVADNGSSDDSIAFVKRQYPQVQIVALDKNYGFAEGYNQALNVVDAEYFVLLNSDVEPTQGWLSPLINYMDQNPEVAVCGPKILDYKRKTHFEYAGAAGGFIDKYGFPFCRGRVFNHVEKDMGQYNDIQKCLWVSGCCLMTRADVYKAQGGLDGKFFAHMEEVDYCWRLNNKGYKVVNIPESVIYHVGGASLKMGSPKKTFLNFRNSLLCLFKNSSKAQWDKVIFLRMVLDGVAAAKFSVTDGWAHFKAVYDAHREMKAMLGDYVKLKAQKVDEENESYNAFVLNRSIVNDYYIKKRKVFTKINF